MWYRVFCTSEEEPRPEAMMECLRGIGLEVSGTLRTDDQGWFVADFTVNGGVAIMHIERFLAQEDGIRAELNTWAAWAESAHEYPPPTCLMQEIISTKQLFAWQRPASNNPGINIDRACLELCRFLANKINGVYQVDGEGFFSNDGTPLVGEN
jgi:hypothetical protein